MATPRTRADCAHLTQGVTTPLPRLWAVMGLTSTFMIIEVVGGWVSGSLALLADAGHMLTDVGALGLTLLTAWIARRPANDNKTYGYLRWEILAALVNGAALFGIAGWVVVEAVQRIHHPEPVRTGLFLAIAAAPHKPPQPPGGGGAPPCLPGGGPGTHAGRARRLGGARPPRLDRHQRH